MKRIKLNLASMAMLIGISGAFAFTTSNSGHRNLASLYWRNSATGAWQLVGDRQQGTGSDQYTCEAGDNVCTAMFDSQPLTNADPDENDIVDNGEFTIH